MSGKDRAICIDCDTCQAFPPQGPRRDLVILDAAFRKGAGRWLVVEVKGNADHPRHAIAQLSAGAAVIADDARFGIEPSPGHLTPLVLHRGHLHTTDLEEFAAARVQFRGAAWPVRVRDCGAPLSQV